MAEWLKFPTRLVRDPRVKKLGREIGNKDVARWMPLALLVYCTELESDNVSALDAAGLADALDYDGDPARMKAALIAANFLSQDGTTVCDWAALVGVPLKKSRLQRQGAAKARWAEVGKEEETRPEETRLARMSSAYAPDADRIPSVCDSDADRINPSQGSLPNSRTVPSAEAVYEAYPKKVARSAALKSIVKVKDVHRSDLLERVEAYAKATNAWPADEAKFIPNPATWFNQGRYNDDPSTWIRTSHQPVQTSKPESVWELQQREASLRKEISLMESEGREYRTHDQCKAGEYPGYHMKDGYAERIAAAQRGLREIQTAVAGIEKDES